MAKSTSTKVGHGLAKVLGIKLHYRDPTGHENLSRGESVFSVSSADTYVEQEPTTAEWLTELLPTGKGVIDYLSGLFPFVHWIGRYNLQWFLGDLIAGTSKVWRESFGMEITDSHQALPLGQSLFRRGWRTQHLLNSRPSLVYIPLSSEF